MKQKEMSVYDHLAEVRMRLFAVALFFAAALIAGFFLTKPVMVYLQHTNEAKLFALNAFKLTDPMLVYMQFTFIIAIIITSPVILYQLWAFVSPGLYEKERKVTLSYIPIALLLFLLGISFGYFVLFPIVVGFMTKISRELGIAQVIGVHEYFTFLIELVLPFGLLFQLPVAVMFLTRLGMVTPMLLSKMRRYAYVILLVVAAFITPPEVLSQILVAVPLILLYEVSIIISRISYRKAQKSIFEEQNQSLSK
ncbi:twin-arginine translocase subunit TatC [Metabacillus sp. GX 13764]|uniref:twin-arginine translocase subunit TatC n=1 Tax=Metabacillus kandeliae TaxID=2900151 RepID=UPI001E5F40C3|nr:twin-arginine translocase subunit TatC [Metabacillus kandeliae]MCD7036419.1 twin-arginine translocase subunit TatC [Metabacillus kandeliae]